MSTNIRQALVEIARKRGLALARTIAVGYEDALEGMEAVGSPLQAEICRLLLVDVRGALEDMLGMAKYIGRGGG